jgi:hypothetical protein
MNKYERYNDSPRGQARRRRYEHSMLGQAVRQHYEGARRREVDRARQAQKADDEAAMLGISTSVGIFALAPEPLRELKPHELRVGRVQDTFFRWRYYRDGDTFSRRPQRNLRIGG